MQADIFKVFVEIFKLFIFPVTSIVVIVIGIFLSKSKHAEYDEALLSLVILIIVITFVFLFVSKEEYVINLLKREN